MTAVPKLRAVVAPAAALLATLLVALGLLGAAPASAQRSDGPPEIRSAAAILVEPGSGDIVYARNADERRPIASATKLMTALVALEHASLDDVMTTVPYNASPYESVAGFAPGEKVTVADLIRALLVASANDAAATLAQRIGGSTQGFVEMMNRRARELKLTDTHFANPIGLDDPDNYSSATDLVKIALILRKREFVREVVDAGRVTLHSGARTRTFDNRNTLVRRVPMVDGVKTGHTSGAGYVLVASASRDGVTVLSAVLGASSERQRDRETLALLRYGLRRYHVVTPVRGGQVLAQAPLAHRDETVDLVASRTIKRTVARGKKLQVGIEGVPEEIDGPLEKGDRVGSVVVLDGERVVARIPLVTAEAVDAASFMDRIRDWLGAPLTIALLVLFVAGSLYLVALRRRAVRRRRRRTTSQQGASVA